MKARGALRAAWMPPLLVGAAAAIAAEVAIGILLYAGPGFMRSLTTVLAVQSVALAAGLHGAPAKSADIVDRLRRRWVLSLGAFAVSALYGTLWSLVENLGEGRLGQGLGLALLAGLPLFGCGAVLGGIGAVADADPSGRLPRPGAPAALGAGIGFVITGLLLPRAPIPASLLVGCLVLLSGGGMLYGALLGPPRAPPGGVTGPTPLGSMVPDASPADGVPSAASGGVGTAEVASVASLEGSPREP